MRSTVLQKQQDEATANSVHPTPLQFRHETTPDFIATSGKHRVDYVFQIKFSCTAAVGQLPASTVLLFSIADTYGKSFLLNTRCLRQCGYNHIRISLQESSQLRLRFSLPYHSLCEPTDISRILATNRSLYIYIYIYIYMCFIIKREIVWTFCRNSVMLSRRNV
jgi:hypothetical protein